MLEGLRKLRLLFNRGGRCLLKGDTGLHETGLRHYPPPFRGLRKVHLRVCCTGGKVGSKPLNLCSRFGTECCGGGHPLQAVHAIGL